MQSGRSWAKGWWCWHQMAKLHTVSSDSTLKELLIENRNLKFDNDSTLKGNLRGHKILSKTGCLIYQRLAA